MESDDLEPEMSKPLGNEGKFPVKTKKIAFLGLFGQGNLGNDCTLQAVLHNARKYLPDAVAKCICSGPEEVSVTYNIPVFPMEAVSGKSRPETKNIGLRFLGKVFIRITREFLHGVNAVRALRGSHMLIAAGTGLLVDHSTGFRGYPYYVFKWSIIAKLCRCKLLIISMGAGPIYHPLSRWLIKSALSLADYRSYRDTFSKQYIEGIGFGANSDPVYPDLAFSLPRATVSVRRSFHSERPVIGVGVVDYYGLSGKSDEERESVYRDYLNKMVTFVTWLLNHKYAVRVLIGDVKYDRSVKRDLMELLKDRGLESQDGRIINEPILSVEQLLSQLVATDVVVSPRYHNIILALMLNKPVISLSYNEKFDSLMAGFGLAEYSLPIGEFDVERLIERFIELVKSAEELRFHIERKTEEYRKDLDKQYTMIFSSSSTELPLNISWAKKDFSG
jgi:polysaccharide pyruvyl transferase WcaK-like protein